MSTPRHLIEALNSLGVGELSTLARRLQGIRSEAEGLGLSEVTGILDEAAERLAAADFKAFRKKISHAVSRLGHVREAVGTARRA